MAEENLGKKVFFLYPHSVIKDELIKLIIHYEYEVYLTNKHEKMVALLSRYPDSVIFINIDEELKETEWEEYIRGLMKNPATKTVKIGIMSYDNNPDLKKKYLMDIMVSCGFINLKLGLKESATIILKTLEANEVKGRRKYVRIRCTDKNPATFNAKIQDRLQEGIIIDISSVGMACRFNSHSVQLLPKQSINDIQLRLRGAICKAGGTIIGTRIQEGQTIYVLLFEKNLAPESKSKIQQFIYNSLQNQIDRELKDLKA